MPNEHTAKKQPNRYQAIIDRVFRDHYVSNVTEFEFTRDEFVAIAASLLPRASNGSLRAQGGHAIDLSRYD